MKKIILTALSLALLSQSVLAFDMPFFEEDKFSDYEKVVTNIEKYSEQDIESLNSDIVAKEYLLHILKWAIQKNDNTVFQGENSYIAIGTSWVANLGLIGGTWKLDRSVLKNLGPQFQLTKHFLKLLDLKKQKQVLEALVDEKLAAKAVLVDKVLNAEKKLQDFTQKLQTLTNPSTSDIEKLRSLEDSYNTLTSRHVDLEKAVDGLRAELELKVKNYAVKLASSAKLSFVKMAAKKMGTIGLRFVSGGITAATTVVVGAETTLIQLTDGVTNSEFLEQLKADIDKYEAIAQAIVNKKQ